jgi:putative Mg2+ transporter-C (MgtC) family protein
MVAIDAKIVVSRILLAVLLGALIGFERQWRKRNAGLRTNALVSLGAALFVLISAEIFDDDASPTRIASQVVTGIGFLGAGVIMKEGLNVRGLNTAATLWCSAAVGSLIGLGFLLEAVTGAFTVVLAHLVLRPLGILIERGPLNPGLNNYSYKFSIVCSKKTEGSARAMLVKFIGASPLQMHSLKSYGDLQEEKLIEIVAVIVSAGKNDSLMEEIAGFLSLEKGVKDISWEVISHEEEMD